MRKSFILYSPIIVFTITWTVTLFLYWLNPFLLKEIRTFTWFVIVLGVSSVYLGFFTAKLIGDRFEINQPANTFKDIPFDIEIAKVLIVTLTTISLIGRLGSSYLIFNEIGGLDVYLVDPNYVRNFIIDAGLGATGVNVLLFKIFNYMGSFTTITIVISGAISNLGKFRFISLYPLFVAIVHSVTNLERVYFVKHYVLWISVSLLVIYYLPKHIQKDAIRRFIKKVVYFLLFTAFFVSIVIFIRHVFVPGSQLSKVVNSFYFYIAGNIFWLDKYLITDPDLLMGASIFRSVISWFVRFGLMDPSAMIPPHYEFYPLYDTLGNTFTYLRIPYEDFGTLGILFMSYLWGWFSFFGMKQFFKKFSWIRLYLTSFIIYSFFWSFFGFAWTKVTTMSWKIFLFYLVGKFLLPTNDKQDSVKT